MVGVVKVYIRTVAQSVEHGTHNLGVVSSILPMGGSFIRITSRQGTRAIMTRKIGVLGPSLRCLGLLVRDREDRSFVFDRSVTVEYHFF